MNIITLNVKERELFILYLKQEAITNEGMADQMEKLAVHENTVKRLRIKSLAYSIIATDLQGIEDTTL